MRKALDIAREELLNGTSDLLEQEMERECVLLVSYNCNLCASEEYLSGTDGWAGTDAVRQLRRLPLPLSGSAHLHSGLSCHSIEDSAEHSSSRCFPHYLELADCSAVQTYVLIFMLFVCANRHCSRGNLQTFG